MQLNIQTIKQKAVTQKNRVFRYSKFFIDVLRYPRQYYDALQFTEWVMTDMETYSIESKDLHDIFKKVDELNWSTLQGLSEDDLEIAHQIKEAIPSCFCIHELETYVEICEAAYNCDDWRDALQNYDEMYASHRFYEALRADKIMQNIFKSQEVTDAITSAIQEALDEM